MMNIDIENEFIQACNYWNKGDLVKAFNAFKKLALLGDSGSQINLGVMLECGEGTKPNKIEALFWYKKAWKAERVTISCLNIADLYLKSENRRQAIFWYKKAIELDDDEARLQLAKIKLQSSRRDIDKIKKLLKKVISSNFICGESRNEAKDILKNI